MQKEAGAVLNKALATFAAEQRLGNALKKLKLIRTVIEELKGDDADYAVVEAGLKEIESILG